MIKSNFKGPKKALALTLAAATAFSGLGLEDVTFAATAQTRTDNSMIYFVDCGDLDPTTVPDDGQLGTHNSVTEQVYGEDAVTGYKWGIVDTVSDPLTNGSCPTGGVSTDSSWPNEWVGGDNTSKTVTQRYTKNQYENSVETRHLSYEFELENGTYQVTVGTADPWGCSKYPSLYANYGQDDQQVIGESVTAANGSVTATVTVTDGDLTIDARATGDDNKAINLTYIEIKSTSEDSSEESSETESEEATETTVSDTLSLTDISAFDMGDVLVTDGYYSNSLEEEVDYLVELDENKLLAGFKETAAYAAGMTSSERKTYMNGYTRYTGGGNWENSLIGGHTLGHYMTALAQAVSNPGISAEDKEALQSKIDTIISTLKDCQEKSSNSSACQEGFIFGATLVSTSNLEQQFDNVEAGKTNISTQAWVPWYTMHKILAGLVSIYELTGNEDALTIAEGLGEWTYNRTSTWSTSTRKTVLSIEYGGMNDALYELALCTKDEDLQSDILQAAATFDETIAVSGSSKSLFQKIYDGDTNALNNYHANTTIPKFLGALNRYVVLSKLGKLTDSDKIYLEYAKRFFEMATTKHSYITGGMSEWEHFGQDYVLDSERTNCNNETCCTYNMLKLARLLFEVTGDVTYSDYYESTLINAIVAAQDPDTGMSMYFQPMKSGYFKVYSTETQDFWCCTGSGMENFTKLNDSIYFYSSDKIIVNQYRSSELTWSEKNLKLVQEADLLTGNDQTFTVSAIDDSKDVDVSAIYFRIPDYASDTVTIKVNGKAVSYNVEGSYAVVSGVKAKDVITVTIPMEVTYENLTDSTDAAATDVYGFKYGPFVLAADLGSDNTSSSDIGTTGVTVDIPKSSTLESENITVSAEAGTLSDWLSNINKYMVKNVSEDGSLSFTMTGTSANYTFVPYYSLTDVRYGIYWNFSTDENGILLAKKKAAREKKQLDILQAGYGQNENDELHSLADNGSSSQTVDGSSRWATNGGSFSYRMLVSDTTDTTLAVNYLAADNGKTIKISVGGYVLANETLNYTGDEKSYTKYYDIPLDLVKENLDTSYTKASAVVITFASADSNDSAALYNEVRTYEKLGHVASLNAVTASTGTVTKKDDTYTVKVASDTASVDLSFELEDSLGYMTVDASTIDDSKAMTVDLSTTTAKSFAVRVYAEDFVTYKDYTVKVVKAYDYDESIEYFVDCGDYNVSTVSSGDALGSRNSVTDQAYGEDPVTGYKWGIVDTVSSPLKNGTASGVPYAAYTDNTWPFETNSSISDGADKTATNRYTKNQYENGVAVRALSYAFELEDGVYDVEVGFSNPWGCSDNPALYANIDTDSQTTLSSGVGVADYGTKVVTGTVTVTDGKLTLDARSASNDSNTLAINMSYIIIKVNAEYAKEQEDKDKKEQESETQTETQTETETETQTQTQTDNSESGGQSGKDTGKSNDDSNQSGTGNSTESSSQTSSQTPVETTTEQTTPSTVTGGGTDSKVTVSKMKISSAKSKKKSQIVVKWKKNASVSGYQVQYSLKKTMKKATTRTITNASTTSKKLSGLKAKKKYYVRIRAYKVVDGKKYYGKWSSLKTVKTK